MAWPPSGSPSREENAAAEGFSNQVEECIGAAASGGGGRQFESQAKWFLKSKEIIQSHKQRSGLTGTQPRAALPRIPALWSDLCTSFW